MNIDNLLDNPVFKTTFAIITMAFIVVAIFAGWLKPVKLENHKSCWHKVGNVTTEVCR